MITTRRLLNANVLMLLLVCCFQPAAQEPQKAYDQILLDGPPVRQSQVEQVTAAATSTRLRLVAPGNVVQLRLEVYSELGQKVHDTEQRGGNVLDWHLQSGAGERVAPGNYGFVLTSKNLSGRIIQRVGVVIVGEEKVSVQATRLGQLAYAQQTAVGPVAEEGGLIILPDGEPEAVTVVAHDGDGGEISRTRGALSFRLGKFFSGEDKEQMRLTESGNLGIGTAKPQAKLDVAGDIRSSGRIKASGVEFPDGTVQMTGTSGRVNEKGELEINAASTGTLNKVAKWLDNSGNLGDSTISEVNGLVGINTNTPSGLLHLGGAVTADLFAGMGPDVANGPAFNFGYSGTTFGRSSGFFNVRPDANAVAPNPSLRFMTANVQRMIVTNTGNVGIGTSNPNSKLDVVGNINTTTRYDIAGQPALLSFAGNLFVGANAGAGTAGFGPILNTFVGTGAGDTNVGGTSNTVVGAAADVGSASLINATAIGQRALVTQSHALVLGSINGQNGADADTNVGLGTTAPSARLHVVGTSSSASTPVAILQSSGSQVPLLFRNGATESARIRATNAGSLVLATLNGADKDIVLRAGDDAGTDMMIQSSTGHVGIGTTTPEQKLEVANGAILSSGISGGRVTINNPNNQSAAANFDWFDDFARIRVGGTGVGATQPFKIQGQGDVTRMSVGELGIFVNGKVSLTDVSLEPGQHGPPQALCYAEVGDDSTLQIAACSSSLRYKTDVASFTPGLNLLGRLRPVRFSWKGNSQFDVGLIAEEVERIEPLLVTYNRQGKLEGVKYDRIGVVLLNAVKEQQVQIRDQDVKLKAQRRELLARDARIAALESRFAAYETKLASLQRVFRRGRSAHHARKRRR